MLTPRPGIPMQYKGYTARIDDVVGFHATSVGEFRAAFRESVDDYLATCEKLGKPPERP